MSILVEKKICQNATVQHQGWGGQSPQYLQEHVPGNTKNSEIMATIWNEFTSFLPQDTTRRFRASRQLLMLWKGSCFKLIWHDFAMFCLLYATISAIYRLVLFHNPVHRFLLVSVLQKKMMSSSNRLILISGSFSSWYVCTPTGSAA